MTRTKLPQMESLFLTDGGMETDMIFNRGIGLPCFAAITLRQTDEGRPRSMPITGATSNRPEQPRRLILASSSWRAARLVTAAWHRRGRARPAQPRFVDMLHPAPRV